MVQHSVYGRIRQFVPSLSRLTFNPVFKFLINLADRPFGMFVREFADLPPNHLRIRVGVGNRLLNNQALYLTSATSFWLGAFSRHGLKMDSTIVDLGSGCGRYGHVLRDADLNGPVFSGRYIGVDIDAEAIAWCRSRFDERFTFHLSTHSSASYGREGSAAPYTVPEPSGIADMVFSASLFTHLLEAEAVNYFSETARLLKPGGVAHHAFFCIDRPPRSFGRRHHFKHTHGRAFVESLSQPEAAVAYRSADIVEMALAAGLVEPRIEHRSGDQQAFLVAYKGADTTRIKTIRDCTHDAYA